MFRFGLTVSSIAAAAEAAKMKSMTMGCGSYTEAEIATAPTATNEVTTVVADSDADVVVPRGPLGLCQGKKRLVHTPCRVGQ